MKSYLFEQNVNHCGDIVFEKSLIDSVKGSTPGEWVALENKRDSKKYLAFVNPFRADGRMARVVCELASITTPELYIEERLNAAIDLRQKYFKDQGARLFFGSSDGIPGLVIDQFKNVIVIQFHMLGPLVQRETIERVIKKRYPNQNVAMSAKPESGEEMISLESHFPAEIKIEEQGIEYTVEREKFQKTGFYYDHRLNRKKLFNFFSERDLVPHKVLDLYSYLGSWGAPFHRYLGSNVTFVDQANLDSEFACFFDRYSNAQASHFVRSNVSAFLDQAPEQFEYDLVICDPPAFKKGQDKKREALLGYDSLMKKIVPRLKPGSLLAFSSCTHGVIHQDLDQCVQKYADKSKKKMQLIDLGLQDLDHPMTGFSDKSNYIKYLLYICKE